MSNNPTRRTFLRDCLLLCGGGAAGWTIANGGGHAWLTSAIGADVPSDNGNERRLKSLGLELPAPPVPVAAYATATVTGNLLFTAGHIPYGSDGKPLPGRVGQEMTIEEGRHAARQVGLSVLSTVRSRLGDLDRVVRLVKVLGLVNCTPDFTQQSQVMNGFSELMIDVFGEKAGTAARSAVGVAALPANCPVEIEAIFEIAL